jgi:hypothetical protein
MNCKSLSCRGLRSPLLFQASSRSAFRLPRISHGGLFEIHVHFEPKNGSIPIPGLEFGNFGKRLTFFDEPTKIELEKLIREGRDCERLSQRDAGQLHFM